MKTIVTGGAGLIGSNIVRQLNARGETDILVVDHLGGNALKQRNLQAIQYAAYMERDVFRAAVRAGQIEPPAVFYHLGACSSTTETDEAFLEDNNTGYTREMCAWCLAHGTRFVYASSAATYGDGSQGYSDDERVIPTLKPLNLYGWSKQRFDLWLLAEKLTGRVAGLKYFNVFGPRQNPKSAYAAAVPIFITKALAGEDITIFGDGEQTRDFVFVKDIAAANAFMAEHDFSGVYNVAYGGRMTINHLAELIVEILGSKSKIVHLPERPGDVKHSTACVDKLLATGFRPSWDFKRGLEVTVQSYRH